MNKCVDIKLLSYFWLFVVNRTAVVYADCRMRGRFSRSSGVTSQLGTDKLYGSTLTRFPNIVAICLGINP